MDHNISIDEEWAIFYRVEWKVDLIHKFCNSYKAEAVFFVDQEIKEKITCIGCGEKVPQHILGLARIYCIEIKI